MQYLTSAVAGCSQATAHSSCTQEVTAADFKLPELSTQLAQLKRDVVHGRGFALIKGLPVDRWTTEQSVIAYWGIGACLRQPCCGLQRLGASPALSGCQHA